MSQRDILLDHDAAVRNIELTEAAINILERVGTLAAKRAIAMLKKSQDASVRRLDRTAAKLGAPYPAAKGAAG